MYLISRATLKIHEHECYLVVGLYLDGVDHGTLIVPPTQARRGRMLSICALL